MVDDLRLIGLVRRTCVLAAVAVVPLGCANAPVKRYPAGWPAADEASGAYCEGLTGRYVNKAVRRTGYVSTKNPAVTEAYLSSLLDLLGETAILRAHDNSTVDLHVQSGGMISYNAVGSDDALVAGGDWRCEAGNVLHGRVRRTVAGESLPSGRRTIEMELRRLVGYQLAVHQLIEDCGAYFAVIPGCEQTDDWYLFEPVR